MLTVAETIFAQEMEPLKELAKVNGWPLRRVNALKFILGLPARDDEIYFINCNGIDYPTLPAIWQWSNEDGTEHDQPKLCPSGSGYFHSSNVICAPWNRLSYKVEGGPHGDWEFASWRENPKANGCVTLAHMALRLFEELRSCRYSGRKT